MAALTCSTMRQPKHGVCSATPGRVRQIILPAEAYGVFVQQAGATAGVLYISQASGFTDEAASPTLGSGDDCFEVAAGGSLSVSLGPQTGATRSVYVASGTASATFKVAPLGSEVLR